MNIKKNFIEWLEASSTDPRFHDSTDTEKGKFFKEIKPKEVIKLGNNKVQLIYESQLNNDELY